MYKICSNHVRSKEIFSQIQLAEELQTKLGTVSELVESVPNDVAEVQRVSYFLLLSPSFICF